MYPDKFSQVTSAEPYRSVLGLLKFKSLIIPEHRKNFFNCDGGQTLE